MEENDDVEASDGGPQQRERASGDAERGSGDADCDDGGHCLREMGSDVAVNGDGVVNGDGAVNGDGWQESENASVNGHCGGVGERVIGVAWQEQAQAQERGICDA